MEKYTQKELQELQQKARSITVAPEHQELLNIVTNPRNFMPIDQRTFFEFVRDTLVDQLMDTHISSIADFDDIFDLFEAYKVDGTMTYSANDSRMYIYAFQDDFNMSNYDYYNIDYYDVFANPESFLVDQVVNCAFRLCSNILNNHDVDEMTPTELIEVLNNYDAAELNLLLD